MLTCVLTCSTDRHCTQRASVFLPVFQSKSKTTDNRKVADGAGVTPSSGKSWAAIQSNHLEHLGLSRKKRFPLSCAGPAFEAGREAKSMVSSHGQGSCGCLEQAREGLVVIRHAGSPVYLLDAGVCRKAM